MPSAGRSPTGSGGTEDGGAMRGASASFGGFSREAFTFLADLSRNNNKTWFDAHRGVYDAAVVAPALQFIAAMGASIREFAPSVVPEPKIGGSLFRIHRDTRFSPDKSPYKTHVGIRFRDGNTARSSGCTGPLFYVEFDARNLRLGVGVKEFDPRTLEAYRNAVAGTSRAKELGSVVHRAAAQGHELIGDTLARVPPGYADQSGNELLRRKGLFVREQGPLPKAILGPEFVGHCGRWFRNYAPLFHTLRAIALEGLGR